MVDVVEGLGERRGGAPTPASVVSGYVSRVRAAPASFADPVWVIVPGHSTDRPYGPLAWPANHGATLPVAGTPVWVAFDENGTPLIVSWAGAHS